MSICDEFLFNEMIPVSCVLSRNRTNSHKIKRYLGNKKIEHIESIVVLAIRNKDEALKLKRWYFYCLDSGKNSFYIELDLFGFKGVYEATLLNTLNESDLLGIRRKIEFKMLIKVPNSSLVSCIENIDCDCEIICGEE